MPHSAPAPPNKNKKANRIITDLSHITQDDEESDPEASEFDLGTKIKTPKDTMLEELSLMNNKGSKMFQMRQQRVERFIVSTESVNFHNLVPTMSPPTPPPKPDQQPEEPVEEVDEEAEKERRRRKQVPYISPWEQAMKGDEALTATMRSRMAGPHVIFDQMPKYKSFNRMALPFGGFDKGSRLLTFEAPDILFTPEEPEPLPSLQADIRSRPSFNRTPIGWVCSEDNTHIYMELDNNMPFDGETEDL